MLSSDFIFQDTFDMEDHQNDVSFLHSAVTEFYKQHNPDKVNTIDNILEKYAGHEVELLVNLVEKYGVPEHPLFAEYKRRKAHHSQQLNQEKAMATPTLIRSASQLIPSTPPSLATLTSGMQDISSNIAGRFLSGWGLSGPSDVVASVAVVDGTSTGATAAPEEGADQPSAISSVPIEQSSSLTLTLEAECVDHVLQREDAAAVEVAIDVPFNLQLTALRDEVLSVFACDARCSFLLWCRSFSAEKRLLSSEVRTVTSRRDARL